MFLTTITFWGFYRTNSFIIENSVSHQKSKCFKTKICEIVHTYRITFQYIKLILYLNWVIYGTSPDYGYEELRGKHHSGGLLLSIYRISLWIIEWLVLNFIHILCIHKFCTYYCSHLYTSCPKKDSRNFKIKRPIA